MFFDSVVQLSFQAIFLYLSATNSMNNNNKLCISNKLNASVAKDKNWTAYTDNCLYKTLSDYKFDYRTTISILQKFDKNSHKLHDLQDKIISNSSVIKAIIGTIGCCSGVSLLEQRRKTFPAFHWRFQHDPELQMNVTFLETNLIRSSYYSTHYEYIQIQLVPKRIYRYIHGKANVFSVLSMSKTLNISLFCFPTHNTKVNFLFFVTDKSLALYLKDIKSTFVNKPMVKMTGSLDFCNPKVYFKSLHILLDKLLRVKLRFIQLNYTQKVDLFDGPDIHTKLITQIRTQIIMSTFQCYLIIYDNTDKYLRYEIKISSIKQEIFQNITLNNTLSFNSKICDQKQSQHCILQFFATDMYINMSIINMTYNGPNFQDCTFGGLTYHGINVKLRGGRRYMTTLCDNYTQTPGNNSFTKVPMNYVSTEFHLLIIIFSYYPYNSKMDININLSLTPCRGILCLDNEACKYVKCRRAYMTCLSDTDPHNCLKLI